MQIQTDPVKRERKQTLSRCRYRNRCSVEVDSNHTNENLRMLAEGITLSKTSEGGMRLAVAASRQIQYSTVHSSSPIFDEKNSAVREAVDHRPMVVVIDAHVNRIYGAKIKAYLDQYLKVLSYVPIGGEETSKTWATVQRICEEAVRVQLPRHGLILAIGGGVTLDVAGFSASIFRRGINFIRVPTSLIGQVDVAVGIKQGINFLGNKGVLGTFYPATVNINDITFLSTLPARHISCGMAEIIKMAVVRDDRLFSLIEANIENLTANRFQKSVVAGEILVRAEQLMMEELQPNLFESKLLRLPDFGHTFSPAIEKASSWSVNHGEAVGMDMLISTGIAVVKGLCPFEVFTRLRRLLFAAKLPLIDLACNATLLLGALKAARSHRAGDLNLVVPLEIGRADFIQHVSTDEIQQSLDLIGGGQRTNAGCVNRSGWDASPVWSVAGTRASPHSRAKAHSDFTGRGRLAPHHPVDR
jgi:3-dehydroquinate synthase